MGTLRELLGARIRFLWRAFAPHLLLSAAAAASFAVLPFESWALPRAAILFALVPVAWYFTDLAVTARRPGGKLLRDENDAGVLLGFSVILASATTAAALITWEIAAIGFVAFDLITLAAFLIRRRAFHAFLEIVPDLLRTEHRETVRAEAHKFYRENRDMLAEEFPPAMFRTFLQINMHEGVEPDKAWQAYQELLRTLHPLVVDGRRRDRAEGERRRREESRAVETEREIRACEARLAQLRASDTDAELLQDEIDALDRRLRQLRERRELHDTLSPEDL